MKKKIALCGVCILISFFSGCSKPKDYSDLELNQLKSLPYVSWTAKDIDNSVSGVITHQRDKVYPGYNLYLNLKDRAFLLDMDGTIVHTWFMPYHTGQWEYGYLKPNGNLVAYCTDLGVTEIDWYSTPIWYTNMRAHHDVEQYPDGSYLVPDTFRKQYKSRTILFNSIRHLSKDGKILDEWSTWEHFEEIKKLHLPSNLEREPEKPEEETGNEYDYYHLNTIKFLPENKLEKKDSRFREGNWLICLRNVNLILILDKDTKEIVWDWGPENLDWPHMPVMLKNGDILIFDNGINIRKYSRVIQVDPVKKAITWEYKTDPPENFFSNYWGSVQRFPNKNTLITNSASGHVFEITEKKKIVWEFYNSNILNDTRKRIYRMTRYPEEMIENLLNNPSEKKLMAGHLKNPGFEQGDNLRNEIPAAWKYSAWLFDKSTFTWDTKVTRTGNRSAKIVFDIDNVGYWGQLIHVLPHTMYRLSGWVKTENVASHDSDNYSGGASIAAKLDNKWPFYSDFISGTNDWTELTCEFNTGDRNNVEIQCKIGTSGVELTGTVWFDDIRLKKVN